jgi:hypothetical protein
MQPDLAGYAWTALAALSLCGLALLARPGARRGDRWLIPPPWIALPLVVVVLGLADSLRPALTSNWILMHGPNLGDWFQISAPSVWPMIPWVLTGACAAGGIVATLAWSASRPRGLPLRMCLSCRQIVVEPLARCSECGKPVPSREQLGGAGPIELFMARMVKTSVVFALLCRAPVVLGFITLSLAVTPVPTIESELERFMPLRHGDRGEVAGVLSFRLERQTASTPFWSFNPPSRERWLALDLKVARVDPPPSSAEFRRTTDRMLTGIRLDEAKDDPEAGVVRRRWMLATAREVDAAYPELLAAINDTTQDPGRWSRDRDSADMYSAATKAVGPLAPIPWATRVEPGTRLASLWSILGIPTLVGLLAAFVALRARRS